LLYSRFFTKALNYKDDKFKISEPFKGLFTQGMVCHETYKIDNEWFNPEDVTTKNGIDYFLKNDLTKKVTVGSSESMSKSKKNTIDPEKMIENYGADSVRFFILSDSPPEKDVQWSDQGMQASFKFVQKFWSLSYELNEKIKSDKSSNSKEEEIDIKISIFTNQIINKITTNLENFHYNVIIANFHEIYNFFSKINQIDKLNYDNLRENYIKILYSMKPVLPHLVTECLSNFDEENKNIWPEVDKKYLEEEFVNIVVQINGKKRNLIKCKKDIEEDELIKIINVNKDLKKYFENKEIIKHIYVKNKIINYIVK
jgi:leucyl-tRNA synthetase